MDCGADAAADDDARGLACGAKSAARDDSGTMPCSAGGSCPRAGHSQKRAKHGRAYLLGDAPGGVVVRGLGKLIVDLSLIAAPLPSQTPVEIPAPRFARAPDPEIRPPTFARTSVRLARAPPAT